MKYVNRSDSKPRRCAFCGGLVIKKDDGKWYCTSCHFWYDKLLETPKDGK